MIGTIVVVFAILGCVNIFGARAATPPSVIAYQGKILANGLSVTTTIDMKFVLYDSSSGGTARYTASGTLPTTSSISITPTSGLFSVNLGDTVGVDGNPISNEIPADLFQTYSDLYLEVTVNGQTLSPRKRITSVPYAFHAATAVTSTYATNAGDSVLFDGMSTSSFATSSHGHNLSILNNDIGFVTSSVVASSSFWDTAYSWGDHSLEDYLTGYSETDPIWIAASSSYLTVVNAVSSYLSLSDWNTTTTLPSNIALSGLTQIGTVSTGTWQGTIIGTGYGGTNTTTLGAAGTMAYSDGTGYAFTGASSLFWDNANSRLGVGTSTPASLFEVYSASADAPLTITSASTADPYIAFRTGATPATQFVMGVDASDSNKFKISTSSNIGSNTVFNIDSLGNVGMGTTTPAGKLVVVGTDPAVVQLKVYPAAGQSANLANFYNTAGTAVAYVAANGDIVAGSTTGIKTNGIISANGGVTAIQIGGRAYTAAGNMVNIPGATIAASSTSGTVTTLNINPLVTMGGTSAFNALLINPTVNTLGSGSNYLLNVQASSSPRFVIDINGNVGVGTSTPAYKLQVYISASIEGHVVAADGTWANTSDARLKKNISTMSNGLSLVSALRPVYFDSISSFTDNGDSNLGFIAQEVEPILPQVVDTNPISGYKSISYAKFTPILVAAIQEQQAQIQALMAGLASSSPSTTQQLTITSPAITTFDSKITFNKHVVFGEDTVGQAKIITGATSTYVGFKDAYDNLPVVTISPLDFVSGTYRILSSSTLGFAIEVAQTQEKDISFNWHAFDSVSLKSHNSDGSVMAVSMVIAPDGTMSTPDVPASAVVVGNESSGAELIPPVSADDFSSTIVDDSVVSSTTSAPVFDLSASSTPDVIVSTTTPPSEPEIPPTTEPPTLPTAEPPPADTSSTSTP